MRKLNRVYIIYISFIISLSAFSEIGDLPTTSAEGTWEKVLSIPKIIEIPSGEEYFVHFDTDSGTVLEMMLPSLESGLSQKAKDALSQVPSWLYRDLAKKFGDLGDTTIDFGDFATPVFADMDSDGDLDLTGGSQDGSLYYYENVGMRNRPIFVEDPEFYSSLSEGLSGVTRTSLAPVDWDSDFDYDLIVGNSDGSLYFIENIGTPKEAMWGIPNVITGYTLSNSHPAIADLDDDGDFDLAVGGGDGYINFYENEGNPQSPDWQFSYRMNTGEQDDRPICFADMDDDGDFDLSVGDGDFATLYCYQNVGTTAQEAWAMDATIYSGINPEYGTSPAIADLNGDERPDLVVGVNSGTLYYYKNIGSASNARWQIWSFYQVVEGYNYYPKEVLLNHRSDHWMDIYADLILGAAQKYKDEIGFAIAHTPNENLKALNQNQVQIFVDNAELIYEIDDYLDYVEVIEKEGYTTTRYRFGEPPNTIERELPRDIYYWFIVQPKITDENVFYIHPDDSDPNHPTDPDQGGRFWREYLFYHADSAYPPDNSGSPDDGVDDYPQDISPPKLKDALTGITTLWNDTKHFAPAGRSMDYGENALIRVSNWVGWTLFLNQQEVSDDERPIQPVRIAHHHNGNCGELQDITTAAARTALIPAAGIMLLGEDHVWIEFYENGWHQWDNYWSHGGSVIDNFDTYWGGWGQRGGSGIWKQGGDDDTWEVTDHYIPEEDLNYVTIKVMDNNGDPVDGARVLVISYWLKV
ncbi:MAG: VCBS repeat-containing protein, partial [Thermoplasmata archaeon]